MNTLTLVLVALCLVAVNGRHARHRKDDSSIDEDIDDAPMKSRRDDIFNMRHRRRRWLMNNGYDPGYHSGVYNEHEISDHIHHIYRLLEDILSQLKERKINTITQQPVYIPYPMPYPTGYLGYIGRTPHTTTSVPIEQMKLPVAKRVGTNVKIESRFPAMEDPNMNWGFVPEQGPPEPSDGNRPLSFDPVNISRKNQANDEETRPISFKPISPKEGMKPSPPVDRESKLATATPVPGMDNQTPYIAQSIASKFTPEICDGAIIACCGFDEIQQRICFNKIGCNFNSNSCSPWFVRKALDSVKMKYSQF